jgi:hypothetical protein
VEHENDAAVPAEQIGDVETTSQAKESSTQVALQSTPLGAKMQARLLPEQVCCRGTVTASFS